MQTESTKCCIAGDSAQVMNLMLSSPVVVGRSDCAGGLVGQLEGGLVKGCNIQNGRITSTSPFTGGLVEVAMKSAFIEGCHAHASVKGTETVGGLVGWSQGSIHNCRITGMIMGETLVGGVAGRSEGTVTQCSVQISLYAEHTVGGLTGTNSPGSQIAGCSVRGDIWGTSQLGGLSGQSAGTILNAYSLCSVFGIDQVGGLVGHLGLDSNDDPNDPDEEHERPSLVTCYVAGALSGREHVGGLIGYAGAGEVTQCLWDIQTTKIENMCGQQEDVLQIDSDSKGANTSVMQNAHTFTAIGWQIVKNQTAGDWIVEAGTYPRLYWECDHGFTPRF